MTLMDLTAVELGQAIRKGEVTPTEAVQQGLDCIRRSQEDNPAYITVTEELALKRAKEWEQQRPEHPLSGVPAGIKDNLCTKGIKTTCASRMLAEFVAPYDATVVERFTAGGGILLGKQNLDEFAMGATGETSWFGTVKNPWDSARTAGGSSSGSAAAVAEGSCWYALASDTGGSIRQPSAFCGVTGMKPTYGSVSRYGLIAHASSLDQIGPIARTAEDCAAVLDLIRGQDPRDSTTVPLSGPPLLEQLTGVVTGLRVGVPAAALESVSEGVRRGILETAEVLRARGAVVEECELPLAKEAVAAYYILSSAQASSNLARYDGVKYGWRDKTAVTEEQLYTRSRSQGFGAEVQRRILMGTFVLSAEHYHAGYEQARKAQAQVRQAWNQCLERYDLLLMPVTGGAAPVLGRSVAEPLALYWEDVFTVGANLTGLPAISIPCTPDAEGLPLGVQLIGRAFADGTVLNAAYAVQQDTPYHRRRPGEGKVK